MFRSLLNFLRSLPLVTMFEPLQLSFHNKPCSASIRHLPFHTTQILFASISRWYPSNFHHPPNPKPIHCGVLIVTSCRGFTFLASSSNTRFPGFLLSYFINILYINSIIGNDHFVEGDTKAVIKTLLYAIVTNIISQKLLNKGFSILYFQKQKKKSPAEISSTRLFL